MIAGRLDFEGLSSGATVPLSGNVSGAISQNVLGVSNAETLMRALVTSLGGLTYDTATYPTITASTTINTGNTSRAFRVTTLDLGSGEVLTIVGVAGTQVVINVTSSFGIGGNNATQGITLSGGIRPQDVIFFYNNAASGSSQDVSFTGNPNAIDNFTGILISTNNRISATAGTVNVNGFIWQASINTAQANGDRRSVSFDTTGFNFTQPTFTEEVPEPATVFSFGAGVAILAALARRKSA